MTFLNSERADAELIGHVIILGLTIIGIGLISVVGVPTIFKLQDMAVVRNVEQTYTLLDSRASSAIMGSSPLQMVDMNLGGGTITVEPNGTVQDNRSYMIVSSPNFTFTIPMGKLKYHLGDRIIAYEGGGVWSKYPSGGSVMLSPPEFHYNGWTLTLPVVNLYGNSSAGGKGTASISFKNSVTRQLYPNASNPDMVNPVNGSKIGKVYVNITSEFYDAWAEYAKSLVYTKVVTNSTTRTANIELTVIPSNLGVNTSLTSTINFRGIDPADPTPVDDFSMRLEAEGNDGLNIDNWQMRASSSDGNRTLIYYLTKGAGNPKRIEIRIGYKDMTHNKIAEVWEGIDYFRIFGDHEDEYADVNFLNQTFRMKYDSVGIPASNCGGDQIQSSRVNETAFTPMQTGVSPLAGKTITYQSPYYNQTQTLYNVTQHYLNMMSPDIRFDKCGPLSDPVDYEDSTLLLNYSSSGALTYLDITRNDVNVSVI